jgi:hypothetical protein
LQAIADIHPDISGPPIHHTTSEFLNEIGLGAMQSFAEVSKYHI